MEISFHYNVENEILRLEGVLPKHITAKLLAFLPSSALKSLAKE